MKKQMLIFPIVAAMIFTIVLATVESASAQNATMGGNATNDNLSNPILDKKSG